MENFSVPPPTRNFQQQKTNVSVIHDKFRKFENSPEFCTCKPDDRENNVFTINFWFHTHKGLRVYTDGPDVVFGMHVLFQDQQRHRKTSAIEAKQTAGTRLNQWASGSQVDESQNRTERAFFIFG